MADMAQNGTDLVVILAFSHFPILSGIVAMYFSCAVVSSYCCRRLDLLPSSCRRAVVVASSSSRRRLVVVDVLSLRRHVADVVLLCRRRTTGVIVISIRRGFCLPTSACL
jgi:hypothetical protein